VPLALIAPIIPLALSSILFYSSSLFDRLIPSIQPPILPPILLPGSSLPVAPID